MNSSRNRKPYDSAERRARYLATQEEARRKQREWTAANPLKRMAHNANTRAISLGISGRLTDEDIQAVFLANDNKCAYCGADADTVDHVVPLSRAGSNCRANLVACCQKCNLSKRAMLVSEWIAKTVQDAVEQQRRAERVRAALAKVADSSPANDNRPAQAVSK